MAYAFLALAILSEVAGTVSLRMATRGSGSWYAAVAVGYAVAFVMLALALDRGMGIGVAYGIWSASGVALTALLGRVLFAEAVSRTMACGIVLIIAGVLLVELGRPH
ncbi:DMT family transporter [Motilibacter deserti]|uniref:QacE family quaternary ammonium compound efflux SMR transporter n=1 Tax=Motilibacter deserti TaxID=2714956 RepID=A0ABX0GRE1_9ACTN|nr:SMR family transporter [Motilibacter deserti]NHC12317.1 QacE family quaternary ammonium compound efflux SMR transporter [Motilibacter deserti]